MPDSKRISQNERLRQDRLTFYKEDVDQIDKLLAEFLRLSGAKCALLIDKEGHLVTKRGELRTIDIDTISALVAGSFAATKEMARLLGEEEEDLLEGGLRDHPVDDSVLVLVLCEELEHVADLAGRDGHDEAGGAAELGVPGRGVRRNALPL